MIDVHLEHLQPFNGSIKEATKAAKLDSLAGEYEVEQIVDYRLKRNRRTLKNIEFRVRWSGWGQEHDTWLPYKDVSDLKALDDFLLNNPQLQDIVPIDSDVVGPLKEGSVVGTPTRNKSTPTSPTRTNPTPSRNMPLPSRDKSRSGTSHEVFSPTPLYIAESGRVVNIGWSTRPRDIDPRPRDKTTGTISRNRRAVNR